MTTSEDNNQTTFTFSMPAIYQIKVLGKVQLSRSGRLSGMNMSHQENESGFVTTLVGRLNDQAELSGILNSLHDLHMSVLSVERLNTTL